MKKILSKLWLGITALVLIIISLLWLFQIVGLEKFYINERKASLLHAGEKIKDKFLDEKNITEDMKSEIDSYMSSFDAIILIYDNKENLLYNSNPFLKIKDRKPEFRFDKKVKKEIKILPRRFPHPDSSFIISKIPIIDDNEYYGYVLITSPLAPIEEATNILKKQLTLISLISIIIATLLALAFARYFSNPLVKITKASEKIAKGDFSANVDINTKDEIGTLAKTINNMAIKLGQTEKLRKEFIANMSHELKTPISLIRAYSELIKDIDLEENEREEYLDIITDESKRLNSMVEDILYLSKMEAGFLDLKYNDFYIYELVKDVLEKLNYFAKKKNIDIKLLIDDKNKVINGDESKIYQVFYNLINNAINHSFKDGTVTIKINTIKNITKVKIIDNGKGIPKDKLPFIWDRFYKVEKSRKRDFSGTGLGMSIVKSILDAHKFNYGIESEVNKGTTIWIDIDSYSK
ncbi:MAG: HAMP domain-containing histidine kinase [Firmicutes bacterium]|nr:HAMP domain-containing histidine kinase [Bacillota bacterium]